MGTEKTKEINVAEAMKRVEDNLLALLKQEGIKFKSKTYYKYEHLFISGAITMLDEVPPKWGIALMTGREVLEEYKL